MKNPHRHPSTEPRRRSLGARLLTTVALTILVTGGGRAAAQDTEKPEVCDDIPGQYIIYLDLVKFGTFLSALKESNHKHAVLQVPADSGAASGGAQIPRCWQDGGFIPAPVSENTDAVEINCFLETAEFFFTQLQQQAESMSAPVQELHKSRTSVLVRADKNAAENYWRRLNVAANLNIANLLPSFTENLDDWMADTSWVGMVRDRWLRAAGDLPADDPLLYAQWALHRTGVPGAWGTTTGSRDITVAVIDSGVDTEHAELRENLKPQGPGTPGPGKQFCTAPGRDCNENDLTDPTGHGTAMAGIIGAASNDGVRTAGVNREVRILSLKVLGERNLGSVGDVAAAIRHATDEGAQVISLSVAGPCASRQLLNVIIEAQTTALVVVAAGNRALDLDSEAGPKDFPAGLGKNSCCERNGFNWYMRNVLVVGATDLYPGDRLKNPNRWRDRRAPFSNYGPQVVDLGAPGKAVLTTGLEANGGVAEVTGTSAATALVAGAAALVASVEKDCRAGAAGFDCTTAVKRRLLDGADRICELEPYFAEGRRLNVLRAIQDCSPPASCVQQSTQHCRSHHCRYRRSCH